MLFSHPKGFRKWFWERIQSANGISGCLKPPSGLQLREAGGRWRGSKSGWKGGRKRHQSTSSAGLRWLSQSGLHRAGQPSPGPGKGGAGRRRPGCPLLPASLGCRALGSRGGSEGALPEPESGVRLAELGCRSSAAPGVGESRLWGRGAGRVQVSSEMLPSLCQSREAGTSGSRRRGAPDPTCREDVEPHWQVPRTLGAPGLGPDAKSFNIGF